MNKPPAKPVNKILAVIGVLSAMTLLYSYFQENSLKVALFAITTFSISTIVGFIISLVGKLMNASGDTFLRRPHKVIITMMMLFGFSKIVGAAISELKLAESTEAINELEAESKFNSFISAEYGVSFKYPINWKPETPQRASTLILLYEKGGTEATCNFSVVAQDQSRVENYNVEYFKENLAGVYQAMNNIESKIRLVNGKKISWTKFDFHLPVNGKAIKGSSITLTALHNGKRFMLVFNAPKEKFPHALNDIESIISTLTFQSTKN